MYDAQSALTEATDISKNCHLIVLLIGQMRKKYYTHDWEMIILAICNEFDILNTCKYTWEESFTALVPSIL